jgi:hypothetical protein
VSFWLHTRHSFGAGRSPLLQTNAFAQILQHFIELVASRRSQFHVIATQWAVRFSDCYECIVRTKSSTLASIVFADPKSFHAWNLSNNQLQLYTLEITCQVTHKLLRCVLLKDIVRNGGTVRPCVTR